MTKKHEYTERFREYIEKHYGNMYKIINIPEKINAKIKVKLYCSIHNNEFEISWDNFSHGKHGCKECSSEKKKQTNLKKYGTEFHTQSDVYKSKFKKTCLDRYGVEYPFQSAAIRRKSKATMIEKYGVDHYSKTLDYKYKYISTSLARYGVDHPFQAKQFQYKYKQTSLKRYGVKNPSQSDDVQKKFRKTCLETYGVEWPKQSHIDPLHIDIINDKEKLHELICNKSLTEIAKEFNVNSATISRYAKKHGIVVPKSSYETSIASFLDSNDISYIHNTKSIIYPYELDFYIPEHNLAIEFCGIYWHAENKHERITPEYHKMKYEKCKEIGITLITIFEYEWNTSTQNKILYHLGLSTHSWLPEETEIIADLRFGEDKLLEEHGYIKAEEYPPEIVESYRSYGFDVYDCGKIKYVL